MTYAELSKEALLQTNASLGGASVDDTGADVGIDVAQAGAGVLLGAGVGTLVAQAGAGVLLGAGVGNKATHAGAGDILVGVVVGSCVCQAGAGVMLGGPHTPQDILHI